LERLLLERLRPLSKKQRERLFDGFGPLASFASKIEIGFALNLFGEEARLDLLLINKIRNTLAHQILGFGEWSFRRPEIATMCKEFRLIKTYGTSAAPGSRDPDLSKPRGQFIGSVYTLSSQLEGERIANKQPLYSPKFLQR
jgi:hypothetical protein